MLLGRFPRSHNLVSKFTHRERNSLPVRRGAMQYVAPLRVKVMAVANSLMDTEGCTWDLPVWQTPRSIPESGPSFQRKGWPVQKTSRRL